MSTWAPLLIAVLSGLTLVWLTLLAALWLTERKNPDRTSLRDAARRRPDLIRLMRRLAADPTLPRGVRIRLVLLLGYLPLPIDLVPDVIPVLGYADDALIIAIALRSVTRRAGPALIEQYWPGTPTGLRTVRRLAGLLNATGPGTRRAGAD